jgi:Spy/CpxP family protein refolding chaperone
MMAAAVALLALSMPVPAFSQMMDMSMKAPRGGHGQMMEMGNMDRMGDMTSMCVERPNRMGLSDEQIMQIKPVHNGMQKKQAKFRADLAISEIELMKIMEVKDFDQEKAGSALKKITGIKTSHQLAMLKDMKEIREILTDEQFNKMKEMMPIEKRKNRSENGMMRK